MIDICLVSWQTEYDYQELRQKFSNSALYHQGILKQIDYPLREPPTGLLILAAILESAGYAVDVIDCMILEDPELFFQENGDKYRLYGFTSLTNTFPPTIELIKQIRELSPTSYIVAGGPHVTFTFKQELQRYPEIDVIFQGEAEHTFLWFVDQILQKPIIDMIYDDDSNKVSDTVNSEFKVDKFLTDLYYKNQIPPGIAFREFSKNKASTTIVSTGFPETIQLDTVPHPARHLINRIYQVADIIINRGCPNQCSFCSRTKLFPITRIRSLEDVLEEVDYILSCRNYKFMNFYDNINVNHKYFNQFLDGLIARKMPLPWGAELRADVITLEEAHKLKRANCQLIATGIESSSREVLKKNFKFQNPEKVARGIRFMKEAGIAIQAYFIIGLPGDNIERFEKTLQFAKELPFEAGRDRVNFFLLTPYPGSDLATYPEKYGIKILSNEYLDYTCNDILIETESLNAEEIKVMLEKATKWKTKSNL
jgi:radical SAM superfamily enzyme YgiQ (UPF0313 family)